MGFFDWPNRYTVETSLDKWLENINKEDLSKMKAWVEENLKRVKNIDYSTPDVDHFWEEYPKDSSMLVLLKKWNKAYKKLDADKKIAHSAIVESTRWSIHNDVIRSQSSYNFSTTNLVDWTIADFGIEGIVQWKKLKVKIKNDSSHLRLRDSNKKIIWKLKQWDEVTTTGNEIKKNWYLFIEVNTSKWKNWWVPAEYVTLVQEEVTPSVIAQIPNTTKVEKNKPVVIDDLDGNQNITNEKKWETISWENSDLWITWKPETPDSKIIGVVETIDSISNYFSINKKELTELTEQLKENWLKLDIVAYLTTYKKYIETNLVWLDDNILGKIKKAIQLRVLELSKIVDERIAWVDKQIEEWDYEESNRIVEIQNQRWIINSNLNDLFTEVNNEILPSAVVLAKKIDLKPLKKTLSTPSWIWMNHKMFEIKEMFDAELTDDWEFNKTWTSLELIDASANYWSVLDSSDEDHKNFMDENKIPGIEGASLLKDKNDINIERNASYTFYALLALQIWAEFTPIWWTAWAWIDAVDMFTDEDVLLKAARTMPWVDSSYRMEKVWYDNVLAGVWLIPGATIITKWTKLWKWFSNLSPIEWEKFLEIMDKVAKKAWWDAKYLKTIKEKILWIKFNKKPKTWNNINIFDVEADAKIKLDKLNLENPNDLFFIRKTVDWKFEVFTTLKSDKLEPILENGKLSGYVFKHTFKKDNITVSAKLDENGKFIEIIDANWKTPWVIKWQITREMKKINWEEGAITSNKINKTEKTKSVDELSRYENRRFKSLILNHFKDKNQIIFENKKLGNLVINKQTNGKFLLNWKWKPLSRNEMISKIDESYRVKYINDINYKQIIKVEKAEEFNLFRSLWHPIDWRIQIETWGNVSLNWKNLKPERIKQLLKNPKVREAILRQKLENMTNKEFFNKISKAKWFDKLKSIGSWAIQIWLERLKSLAVSWLIWWSLSVLIMEITDQNKAIEPDDRFWDVVKIFALWATWWLVLSWLKTWTMLTWWALKTTRKIWWNTIAIPTNFLLKHKWKTIFIGGSVWTIWYILLPTDDDTENQE